MVAVMVVQVVAVLRFVEERSAGFAEFGWPLG